MHPTLTTVLEQITVHEDCDRTALPPLYEAVDPEAVTSLLESNTDVVVRFDYVGYRVAVGPDSHEMTVIDEDS
ncbi:HalOD1 output domain-containing protein [Halopiger aswanensis]|nr:HalOD1 output domain-containing protein [Halopiger aswanensis]